MVGKSKSNLVVQNIAVADVALLTLAARTPVTLTSLFDAMTAVFLAKRVRYLLSIENVTSDQGPFSVAFGPGNAVQTEAASAIAVKNTSGPLDLTQVNAQVAQWNIFQNSMEMFTQRLGANGDLYQTSGEWVSLGKGLPTPEGSGWDFWLYNLDNAALTTGAICKGLIQVEGVWLGS